MKRLILAAAALAANVTVAQAQQAVVWQGEAVIEFAPVACSANPDLHRRIKKGDVFRAVFRPGGLPNNGADHRISFTTHRSMTGLRLTGTGAAGTYNGLQFNQVGSGFGVTGAYSGLALLPVAPLVTTSNLLVRGVINDFFAIAGCNIEFRAGLVLRP